MIRRGMPSVKIIASRIPRATDCTYPDERPDRSHNAPNEWVASNYSVRLARLEAGLSSPAELIAFTTKYQVPGESPRTT